MVHQVIQQQQTSASGNGNVVALAILQFVYGGLLVLLGLLVAIMGGTAAALVGNAFAQWGGETWGALGAAMFILVGLATMMLGALPIIGGAGLMQHRQWGRIITLILATLAGLSAVFALLDAEVGGALIPGGFAAYAWVVLTRPNVTALFNQQQTQQQTIIVETD